MAGVATPEMIVSAAIWITVLTSAAGQRPTGNVSKALTSLSSSSSSLGSAAIDPLQAPTAFSGCPRACFCNTPSRIVYCSRRGLSSIPDGISADSLQLNLNGNAFESTTIVRRNLSRYISLEHLYLSECGLESIEVGAFTDLVGLRWLDLSNNRLRAIDADAFSGLRLQHLFLNGNRNVRIGPDSFAGLETVGLYLHDCSLSSVDPATLGRLNSTLKYLWLNGNELERVDAQLASVFGGLMHLRLGSNPLRCDCSAGWLKKFYDRSPEVFKGAVPPTCLTPRSLKGRHFNELTESELRCQVRGLLETPYNCLMRAAWCTKL
jgi:Leucine-rich repeat (LRR) protein